MTYASIVTFVLAASWISAAPGNKTDVQWFGTLWLLLDIQYGTYLYKSNFFQQPLNDSIPIGALEGQYFRKTGKLISLSKQQLVDCSKAFENLGCHGGFIDNTFVYIKKYGIETEDTYNYTTKDGDCVYNISMIVAKDTECVDIESGSESALQEAFATVGPISIAIDAHHKSFMLYEGGVYVDSDCSSENLDHTVLAVGYGVHNGIPYWLIKNSWGEDWGDEGYGMIVRNKGNMCGIATQDSYPLV